jgi:hypothetical protein
MVHKRVLYTKRDSRIGFSQEGSPDFLPGASRSAQEHETSEGKKCGGKPTQHGPIFQSRMVYKAVASFFLIFSWLHAEELFQVEIEEMQNKTIPTLLYKYQVFNSHDHASVITGRVDSLWTWKTWALFFRVEIPLIFLKFKEEKIFQFDDGGIVNEVADAPLSMEKTVERKGLGDLLTQFLVTLPPIREWSFNLGPEVIFPTATRKDLGTGCYVIRPIFLINRDLSKLISQGSFASFLMKYQFAVGPEDPSRLSVLFLQPTLNIGLPADCFFNLSSEFQLDISTRKWFIPLQLMVGREWNKKAITTIEYKVGLLQDYPVVSQQVEMALGWIF